MREGQRVAGVENTREKVEEETLGAEGMEDHSHTQLTWTQSRPSRFEWQRRATAAADIGGMCQCLVVVGFSNILRAHQQIVLSGEKLQLKLSANLVLPY